MRVRAHVFVGGEVQGVLFRSNTRYEANRWKVTGWVRNLPDGRVEAVFEGKKEDVNRLIEFCRRGPPGALVTEVKVQWENYAGDFRGFNIRHGY